MPLQGNNLKGTIYMKKDEEQINPKIEEVDILNALRNKQFILYYQPILNVSEKKLHGLEALIRWEHPVYGLLSPEHFIPIAEKSSLINQIGIWVLKEACEQYKVWQTVGFHSFRMAINISARHLLHDTFTEQLEKILQHSKVNPNCLEIEITETYGLNDMQRTLEVMQRLKKIGVRISLDDFGTGYNCLKYLIKLPLNTIKN